MSGQPVVFELADRARRLASVRLVQEIGLPEPLTFHRRPGGWQLAVDRPDVARMEYLFEVEDHNGHRTTILDPANPRRAPGAFGDKSVLEFADYRRPGWLAVDPVPATETESDGPVPATLWSPHGLPARRPAPLLVVHDGPEYARLGDFTRYLGAGIATGALPPLRAALLGPGDRNEWYAANPDYAARLVDALAQFPPSTVRIGVGVSLGALALLHAHRARPGTFAGLLLQSGSFFTPELDPQESGFSGFAPVTGFVASITAAADDPAPVPTALTCGTVEENLANNRAMAAQLRRLGYSVAFALVRDAHNYTAWRDALDPHLTRLVGKLASAHAA